MSVQTAEDQAARKGQEAKKERAEKIDFKMVTFVLGGKEYGIDIMNIKEIAHASRFTYVPNSDAFVRGVYNLRGDIISVIDLRVMFHLPAERKDDTALESLLILRIEEHVFGVIVDNIDKVVGVASTSIQAPHPIFGDINVKYIKGIIENQGKLYIILNVEKLFAPPNAEDGDQESIKPVAYSRALAQTERVTVAARRVPSSDVNMDFIKETLAAFKRFSVSRVNQSWFDARYLEWKKLRPSTDIQLKDESEANQFLETFYSNCTGELWSEEYASRVMASLPAIQSRGINIWNPGCGKGYESYSLACLLKKTYPEARIKIWANDSDLLAISMAPNMVFNMENVPEMYRDFMVKGRNGWTFIQHLRDSIFFEFHDVMNANPIPPVDLILCRDTVSFLEETDQMHLLADFIEKAKESAALILGSNETMPIEGWARSGSAGVSVYVKGFHQESN
ncbi:MAG: chemotaxis protein CheW [Spirochaetales bacterium]|nr:MAG: chemotaxis protein CheW [Spirochaetales bacterium]